MNRLGIALLLAAIAMGATAGHTSDKPLLVEGKGVATVAGNAGLSEDARAQQAIDAATAAALIGALQSRFDGYDVQLRLGDMRSERVSLRDIALNGEANLRLGKDEAWLPIRFEALYDTTEQTVLNPSIVLGATQVSTQSADNLPLRGLQAQMNRALGEEYASNQVDFSLADARVVGDDGVRLVVQGDGVARFDGEERVAVTLQALYDRESKRWLDPQYALIEG
ncbi:hypothetical protein [Thermomonas sp. HDW16]|uniref:hypothetical protein n=1 Tax=Thermomonas sp. HDW16 TaxID=2714945 RepID=UPI0014090346|nr:hypothetical protein [Thermomonas sp. HDW16]QIL20632.1 hypothetical protein G7079_07720 [Thermomonas sp. HDW16]